MTDLSRMLVGGSLSESCDVYVDVANPANQDTSMGIGVGGGQGAAVVVPGGGQGPFEYRVSAKADAVEGGEGVTAGKEGGRAGGIGATTLDAMLKRGREGSAGAGGERGSGNSSSMAQDCNDDEDDAMM